MQTLFFAFGDWFLFVYFCILRFVLFSLFSFIFALRLLWVCTLGFSFWFVCCVARCFCFLWQAFLFFFLACCFGMFFFLRYFLFLADKTLIFTLSMGTYLYVIQTVVVFFSF